MQYRATQTVNVGGGHFLTEGATIELQPGLRIPGLEPVLERDEGPQTLERVNNQNNIDHIKGQRTLER